MNGSPIPYALRKAIHNQVVQGKSYNELWKMYSFISEATLRKFIRCFRTPNFKGPNAQFEGAKRFVHSFWPAREDSALNTATLILLAIVKCSSLRVGTIAHALSDMIRDPITNKHISHSSAEKRIERFLDNERFFDEDLPDELTCGVLQKFSGQVTIAMDYTNDSKRHCQHTTLVLGVVLACSRVIPVATKTLRKPFAGKKRPVEKELIQQLRINLDQVNPNLQVTFTADREWGSVLNTMRLLQRLKFDFVIRTKEDYCINGKKAKQWIQEAKQKTSTTVVFRNALFTKKSEYPVATVVIHQEDGMKETWILLCSKTNVSAEQMLAIYQHRWNIECTFKDVQNEKKGMGFNETRLIYSKSDEKRDKMWIFASLALCFKMSLGKAEALVQRHSEECFAEHSLLISERQSDSITHAPEIEPANPSMPDEFVPYLDAKHLQLDIPDWLVEEFRSSEHNAAEKKKPQKNASVTVPQRSETPVQITKQYETKDGAEKNTSDDRISEVKKNKEQKRNPQRRAHPKGRDTRHTGKRKKKREKSAAQSNESAVAFITLPPIEQKKTQSIA